MSLDGFLGWGEAWQIEVSACRMVEVAGVRCRGRNRKTWGECVDDDMKVLGFWHEWAVFRDILKGHFKINRDNDDDLNL